MQVNHLGVEWVMRIRVDGDDAQCPGAQHGINRGLQSLGSRYRAASGTP